MREVNFMLLKVNARILNAQQGFLVGEECALSLEGGGDVYSAGPR